MRFSLLSSANHAVTIIASVARSEWLPPGYPYPPTFPCRTFRTIDCRPSEYGPWQIRTLVEWSNFRNVKKSGIIGERTGMRRLECLRNTTGRLNNLPPTSSRVAERVIRLKCASCQN